MKNAIHKGCGGELIIALGDDGGCDDPECCGGVSYHVDIICKKCRKRLFADDS